MGTADLEATGLALSDDEAVCAAAREGPPAPGDAAVVEAAGTLGAATGAFPVTLEAGTPDRPSGGLAA